MTTTQPPYGGQRPPLSPAVEPPRPARKPIEGAAAIRLGLSVVAALLLGVAAFSLYDTADAFSRPIGLATGGLALLALVIGLRDID